MRVKNHKKIKKDDKIYNNLYLLYFLSAPFVYSKDIIDPTLSTKQIHLALFCCVLMFVLFIYKKERINEIKINYSTILLPISLIIFLLTIPVSLIQATVVSEGLFVLSRISITILFFFLTTLLLIEKKLTVTSLLNGVLIFTFLSSLIACFQVFLPNEFYEINLTMTNKNLLSSSLFLCIPFLMINSFNSKLLNIARYIMLGLILVIIFCFKTRAVIIPLVICGVLMLIYSLFIQIKKGNMKIILITLTILSFLILTIVMVFQNKNSIATLTSSNTFQTRVKLWDNTKSIISENLFFGVGAGNWKVEFANYGLGDLYPSAQEGKMIYQRPHNDFLWFFSEFGIVGFITYCGIFFFSLYYLFKLFRHSQTSLERQKYLILFLSIIGFAFISFFDFPMERVGHQIFFFTLLALITNYYYSTFNSNRHFNTVDSIIKSKVTKIIAFGIAIFSIFIGFKRYEGEKNMRKIYLAHQDQKWLKLSKLVDNSKNKYFLTDPMSVTLDWYKGVAQYAKGDFKNANLSFLEAFRYSPYSIHVLNNLASTYVKMGQIELAIKYYNESIRISPNFEESLLNLSAVYFNNKQYKKAFEEIRKCSIYSTHSKYKVFLPPIIRQILLIEAERKGIDNGEINQLSNDEIFSFYKGSRQLNINFITNYFEINK